MNLKKYNVIRKLLVVVQIMMGIILALALYLLSENIELLFIVSILLVFMIIITVILYYYDDKYITGIVSDLSELMDVLIELKEKEIFPENEDTILSKLQNKVIKLADILKKKNETAIREQENIKSLVSDISHQLKTPIANLKMYLELLRDEGITDVQRKKYLEVVQISVNRLNFLSESMIKISRLESGIIKLNIQKANINETVLKAIKDVFAKARDKGMNITFDTEDEEIETAHDINWTSEAVFNVLDNAVKYTEPGSTIDVKVKKLGMFVSIEISDSGEPISDAEKNQIFQRFYRGENSRGKEGIGVGLYLSRELVVKQGGYMNLKSTPDGNTFVICLPAG